MFKCHVCSNDVEPKRALVPAVVDVLTDFSKTALEDVVLNNHVVCFGCAGKVSHGCPEAKFNFIGAVWNEIRKQLDEKARIEAEAEKARLNAEAEKAQRIEELKRRGGAVCITTRPLLPIAIKFGLKGAAQKRHLRRVNRELGALCQAS